LESFVPNCQTSLNERGYLKKQKTAHTREKRVRQFPAPPDSMLFKCRVTILQVRLGVCLISPAALPNAKELHRQSITTTPLYLRCLKFANAGAGSGYSPARREILRGVHTERSERAQGDDLLSIPHSPSHVHAVGAANAARARLAVSSRGRHFRLFPPPTRARSSAR
jgi:hypothetical protein